MNRKEIKKIEKKNPIIQMLKKQGRYQFVKTQMRKAYNEQKLIEKYPSLRKI